MKHLRTVRAGREPLQLIPIDDVAPRPRRVDEPGPHRATRTLAVPQHRHQRDDAGSTADEQERSALRGLPYEVAADGATELELVAAAQLSEEVRGHLAIGQQLDGDRQARVFR